MDEWVLVIDVGGRGGASLARRIRALGVYADWAYVRRKAAADAAPERFQETGFARPMLWDRPPSAVLIIPDARDAQPALRAGVALAVGRALEASYGWTVAEERMVWLAPPDGAAPDQDDGGDETSKRADAGAKTTGSAGAGGAASAHADAACAALKALLFERLGLRGGWTWRAVIERTVEAIRRAYPEGAAVVALSGGVDSAVAAALVHRALGDRLKAVFVDHGLLRSGEREAVQTALAEALGLPLTVVDAGARFLADLSGVVDPEEKRRRIGERFIREFESIAAGLKEARYLVQGTILPDVVESLPTDTGVAVKSHHNVGGLPERLGLALIEPLRPFYKDEVRALGTALGLPPSIVYRQPFPGPGLAVRVIGEVTAAKLEMVRAADRIVREEIEAAGLGTDVWQYFAVLPGVATVGIVDGARVYRETVAVRAVRSVAGDRASWAHLPYAVLERIAERIAREVPGVGRVVYDITSKPPATIEWE
ncbi:MAG: glutamine-hydrolyzing GMP synthase [Hydrogenibacillus sp.]|nr:glutamine-hydrolyzing GMP synthase [Hydrogenibacillus sp.]